MNKIIDRTYMWFDDRFYILLKDEIEKAYSEGATIHPKIKDALINGAPEVWLPSSTTILGAAPKPWLADWKGRIGNEEAEKKLNEGGEKGSRVHDAIQVWTSDGMVIYNNPKKPLFTPEELFEITKDKVEYVDYIVLREQQEHLECWRLQQWFRIPSRSGPRSRDWALAARPLHSVTSMRLRSGRESLVLRNR